MLKTAGKKSPSRLVRLAVTGGLAAMGLCSPAAAFAADAPADAPADVKVVRVAFHTLDLTKRSEIGMLNQRLYGAVRQVCGNRATAWRLNEMRRYRECKTIARESYELQYRIALNNANARRVAGLSDKLKTSGLRF